MRASLPKVTGSVVLSLSWVVSSAQHLIGASPFIPIPARQMLTNGVYFTDRTKMPQPPVVSAPEDSPATVTNFYSLGWDEVGVNGYPGGAPDTCGAVSTNFCVTILNSEAGVKTRAGQELLRMDRRVWWTNGHPELTNVYGFVDPRILYDAFNERWIATCLTKNSDVGLGDAGILLRVSLTSNPTNAWHVYRIYANTNGGTNFWYDQPTVGYNKDWIVVHANPIKEPTPGFVGSYIWVFNKTNLYAGGTNAPTIFRYGNTNLAGGIIPAVTLDNITSTMYLVQNANGATGALRLFSITGAVGSETLNYIDDPKYIPGKPWADITNSSMALLPQKGTDFLLNATDTRIQNVVCRNGRIWCTQNIFLPTNTPTYCAVQWWCFNPTNGTVIRQGRIEDITGRTNYAYPSIAVNKVEDVLIGYGVFSTDIHPSGAYSFRAFFDQPIDRFRNPRILKDGELAFSNNRDWGDYSATVVDPVNDVDFWTIQEYSTTNEPAGGTDPWGTWWGHIKMDFPANDYFTNAMVLNPLGETLTNFNYRAGKETGETNHNGNSGGASIWYSWTPTNSSQAVVQTARSTIDTVVGVYTGSSVSNLTLVASDYNSGTNGSSKVIFSATSNTTYKIAVDGYNGGSGRIVLNWLAPLGPVIITQPQSTNVIANANENATFSTEASGALPLGYQWRQEGTNIPGSTEVTLTRTNVQLYHATNYTVVVSNS